jgi:outer membrane biosynthesis protein TonB
MARPHGELISLRFSRLEKERLLIALVVSLCLHLGVWGGYQVGKKTGLWQKMHWPLAKKLFPAPKPVVQQTPPPIFLDVAEESAEPPKQAKYYSDRNSRAANPDANRESNQPKLNGKQTVMARVQDSDRLVKAKPTPPAPTPQKTVEPKPAQPNPANTLMPGGWEKAKPEDSPKPDDQPQQPKRPRTLREALAQRSSPLPGLQMQQSGGVQRHALKSSLDASATPFGQYDRALIEAVQQRWDDLLDSQRFALDRTGKVTVTFHLNPDGSVTESKIGSNSVGDLLGYVCQEAIEQAAPFGKWPDDMRRMVGANFREITFTFFYY